MKIKDQSIFFKNIIIKNLYSSIFPLEIKGSGAIQ
jgi:hypothetical protein